MLRRRLQTVEDVAAWRLCCGCGACAWGCPNRAVSLENIIERGIRPRVDEELCQRCGRCITVCPGVALEHDDFPENRIKELESGWGPVLDIWEGYAADSQIRFKSSSGGAATSIALWAIEKGGFAGVLHCKADPDDPIHNVPVFSRTRGDLMEALGSRYAPAAPCQAFDKIRDADGPCVFVGKPCDCAALRKACGTDKELAAKVGLVVSIFCAGTPSTAGTLAVLKAMGIDNPVRLKSLRYRGYGWPGAATAEVRQDGHQASGGDHEAVDGPTSNRFYSMSYSQAWGQILSKHVQLRCRLCPDKTGEFADIAVGDPWYRDTDGDDGRSLILVRSKVGMNCWEIVHSSGYFDCERAKWCRLPESQESLYKVRSALLGRLLLLRLAGIPTPALRGFALNECWRTLATRDKCKALLGTLRRLFTRQWYRRGE